MNLPLKKIFGEVLTKHKVWVLPNCYSSGQDLPLARGKGTEHTSNAGPSCPVGTAPKFLTQFWRLLGPLPPLPSPAHMP